MFNKVVRVQGFTLKTVVIVSIVTSIATAIAVNARQNRKRAEKMDEQAARMEAYLDEIDRLTKELDEIVDLLNPTSPE